MWWRHHVLLFPKQNIRTRYRGCTLCIIEGIVAVLIFFSCDKTLLILVFLTMLLYIRFILLGNKVFSLSLSLSLSLLFSAWCDPSPRQRSWGQIPLWDHRIYWYGPQCRDRLQGMITHTDVDSPAAGYTVLIYSERSTDVHTHSVK